MRTIDVAIQPGDGPAQSAACASGRRWRRSVLLPALTALLTAGAGLAAPIALQPVPPAFFVAPKTSATTNDPAAGVHAGRPGGLNRAVRPASAREKFVPEPGRTGSDVYLVRLHDLPAATYDGRVPGYAATTARAVHAPLAGAGAKWPASAGAAVPAYRSYLRAQQQAVLAAARQLHIDATPRRQFTDALNAFSIELTQAQAQALAALPQVAYVQRSELRPLTTDRGPAFVGAQAVWDGQTASAVPYKGEGVIVGVLDSGANTDHPSFAAVGGDGYSHVNPRGAGHYLGDCATGAVSCNAKLIGVWSWPVITGTYQGVRPPSGEDYNGHGSHTASTAAGNVVLNAPLVGSGVGDGNGVPTGFVFPRVSGVAPHANLVAYQVCYPNGGCPDEAIVTAVEQAITDGVDVINFSIGGNERYPWTDPLALAFLSAREAGIAIAASAGNSGPNFYTLGHSAPWYLVVAASTHDRVLTIPQKTLSLSGGATAPPGFPADPSTTYGGVSATGISNGTLVDASSAGDALCAAPFAAHTFTSSQVVVCTRGGGVARVAKAANVKAGGAGGFVLVNAGFPDDEDDLANDVYPLPGVQLHSWDGQALRTWMAAGGSARKMTISATTITRTLDAATGDVLAEFSSRGPSSTYEGALAPGIAAPGVNIYAAYADEHPFDPGQPLSRDWAIESGTSMASPHVAGAMALVRQAHPAWTPAEVQSALQMTSADSVTYGATPYSPGYPARTYRAGAGRLDVRAAVDAGLVMDETAANFAMADPRNGGDVLQLNLPQLVNSHCRDVCTWIRTVKATRDGTWNVSAGPWTYDRWATGEGELPQNGIRFDAIPSSFTLHAGETRAILFRVDLTDAQFRHDGTTYTDASEQIELWSRVAFTPTNPALPAAHWPVSVNFDHGSLPKILDLAAHRDQGGYRLRNLALPALANVAYRSYGLAAPTVETLTLHQDIDHVPPPYDGDLTHGNTYTKLVDVPAGSARLVAEVLKNAGTTANAGWKRGWATIWVGRDANGNGRPDFADETLCISNTEVELNYCSLSHPDAGRYWIFVNNARTGLSDGDPEDVVDQYRFATAVVPGTNGSGLQVQGPAATTGAPVTLDLNWTLPALAEGDVRYGAFDVGAANTPGSVGFVPLKITRGEDDVSVTLSRSRARPGDVVDVHVHVRENDTGADRAYALQTVLPAGLTLVPGSARVNTAAQRPNLGVQDQTLRMAGTQLDSEAWPADYAITTSANDALCRTPTFAANGVASGGGFVGLVDKLGLTPDFGGHPDPSATDALTLPLANLWGDGAGYALYNNGNFQSYPALQISPQGWVIQEPGFGDTMYLQHEFPYLTFPYTPMIGVLWKGTTEGTGFFPDAVNALATPLVTDPFDPAGRSGVVVAYGSDSRDLVLEWKGARSERTDLATSTTTTLDDRYDFELLLNRDYRYGDGQYEIQMAYDHLNFGTQGGRGSIGVQGYRGPLTAFGPLYADLAAKYAYDDLATKLSNNLVVCYDYRGPESTQFDLDFQVRVSEAAAGTTAQLHFVSQIAGMPDRAVDTTLPVAGNLALAPIADQSVARNGTLSGLPIVYHDNDAGPNTISVTGANVTAVVHGNAPGDAIDLTPTSGFGGRTTVTVSVRDQAHPADSAATSFTLTVGPPDTIFAWGFQR